MSVESKLDLQGYISHVCDREMLIRKFATVGSNGVCKFATRNMVCVNPVVKTVVCFSNILLCTILA